MQQTKETLQVCREHLSVERVEHAKTKGDLAAVTRQLMEAHALLREIASTNNSYAKKAKEVLGYPTDAA